MKISLKEAATGTHKKIRIKKNVICPTCNGSRVAPGSTPKICPKCKGTGRYSISRGFFSLTTTCDMCHGEGKIIDKYCPACAGTGMVKKEEIIEVDIPAGIYDGQTIVLEGKGEASLSGGPNGDMFVEIHIVEDNLFKREGDNIYVEVPISYIDAILGTTILVPTLYGTAKLKVPAGTQPGTLLRLKGQGMPRFRGFGKGDQFVKILVEIPKKVSTKEKELLNQVKNLHSSSQFPEMEKFKQKIEEWKNKFGK